MLIAQVNLRIKICCLSLIFKNEILADPSWEIWPFKDFGKILLSLCPFYEVTRENQII